MTDFNRCRNRWSVVKTSSLFCTPAGRSSGGKKRKAAQPAALPLEGNLGVLLVDFFRLYGRALRTTDVGVSAANGGRYFNKLERDDGDWCGWQLYLDMLLHVVAHMCDSMHCVALLGFQSLHRAIMVDLRFRRSALLSTMHAAVFHAALRAI